MFAKLYKPSEIESKEKIGAQWYTITDPDCGDMLIGTSRGDQLEGFTFKQLKTALGNPTLLGSGDGKVNFTWVFHFKGHIYSLYDYKAGLHYAKTGLKQWSIGCDKFNKNVQPAEFKAALIELIHNALEQ